MRGEDVLVGALSHSADTVYGVPGYPVSGIIRRLDACIPVNEKVALEYALGDSLSGRRSAVILKHVGLNACADPLINATTQGLGAGVVVLAGDDVEATASQNTQDSRYFGEIAQVPVIEPDPSSCAAAVEEAFAASERFSRVAILRVTPPLLEAEVAGDPPPVVRGTGTPAPPGLTMPGRAQRAAAGTAAMFHWARTHPLNRIHGTDIGAGMAPGDSRVVVVYPPPADPDQLAGIRELGRPFLREHRHLRPPPPAPAPETIRSRGWYRTFCAGCPFRDALSMLTERGMDAVCDVGCSILALNPPYSVGVASYGLGSSVAVAANSTGVCLIGDYALLHSGLNALIDVYAREIPLLCIVFNNRRLGMTGGTPAIDPLPALAWAAPIVCAADDHTTLSRILVPPERPVTVVIEGTCPDGESHERVEC